jgi:hypothetical protein
MTKKSDELIKKLESFEDKKQILPVPMAKKLKQGLIKSKTLKIEGYDDKKEQDQTIELSLYHLPDGKALFYNETRQFVPCVFQKYQDGAEYLDTLIAYVTDNYSRRGILR